MKNNINKNHFNQTIHTYNIKHFNNNVMMNDKLIANDRSLQSKKSQHNSLQRVSVRNNSGNNNHSGSDSRPKGWFDKERRIGKGAYGIVYSAKYKTHQRSSELSPAISVNEGFENNEYVAIKRHLVDDKASFIVPVRELSLLNNVRNHPFFVKLKTVSFGNPFGREIYSRRQPKLTKVPLSPIDDKTLRQDEMFFVFEKASCDLHSLIYGREYSTEYMKMAMVQILLGIEYLHSKKIIHRDLKPSNLLWFINGNKRTIKICDMGLSKYMTNQEPTTPKTVTSWYRAPEIICTGKYSYPIDIWSIGCIFIEMMKRKPLFYRVKDNDREIFTRMMNTLPISCLKYLIEVDSDKRFNDIYNDIRSFSVSHPSVSNNSVANMNKILGKTWHDVLDLNKSQIDKFDQHDKNSYRDWIDLISKLLDPRPNMRITATQALNHKFFNFARRYINNVRKIYPPRPDDDLIIDIIGGKARTYASYVAFVIFNNRSKLRKWYSHRILFQAVDMFDRYLLWLKDHNKYDDVSSDDIQMRFMVCVYLSMKLLTTTRITVSFGDIISPEFNTPDNIKLAEEFEKDLMQNILKFNIYRPTVLEAADSHNIKMKEHQIMELLKSYCNSSTVRASIGSLFSHFLFKIPLALIPNDNHKIIKNNGEPPYAINNYPLYKDNYANTDPLYKDNYANTDYSNGSVYSNNHVNDHPEEFSYYANIKNYPKYHTKSSDESPETCYHNKLHNIGSISDENSPEASFSKIHNFNNRSERKSMRSGESYAGKLTTQNISNIDSQYPNNVNPKSNKTNKHHNANYDKLYNSNVISNGNSDTSINSQVCYAISDFSNNSQNNPITDVAQDTSKTFISDQHESNNKYDIDSPDKKSVTNQYIKYDKTYDPIYCDNRKDKNMSYHIGNIIDNTYNNNIYERATENKYTSNNPPNNTNNYKYACLYEYTSVSNDSIRDLTYKNFDSYDNKNNGSDGAIGPDVSVRCPSERNENSGNYKYVNHNNSNEYCENNYTKYNTNITSNQSNSPFQYERINIDPSLLINGRQIRLDDSGRIRIPIYDWKYTT